MLDAAQYGTPASGGSFFLTDKPIVGINPPPPPPGKRPPLREDVPCETQQQPDLRTIQRPPAQRSFRITPADPAKAAARDLKARKIAVKWLKERLAREGRKLPVANELLSRADISKLQSVTK